MSESPHPASTDSPAEVENSLETREWIASLEEVFQRAGASRVSALLSDLTLHAHKRGVQAPFSANTAYVNTIPRDHQPPYPGDRKLERRIKSWIRWNAMAMVVKANRSEEGIGGHISTYASAATLYEVGFNHFFRAPCEDHPGDLVYFQGHASPGIYARAMLEGRISPEQAGNFRHELHDTPGLSSYPHPWLMPDFWQFPTVSMGLGPIMAIYHARFIRYLEDRGLKPRSDQRIWAFLGDGECDEPESLGALTLASRECLDNLIFVINCNLQRLDGPVRGNGKIIQELEAAFRGAGWNVIKVIWGSEWDPLLAADHDGRLLRRMQETPDGQYQRYAIADGAEIRRDFFGADPELLRRVAHLSDEQIRRLGRGGHDPEKVHAAFAAATAHTGAPTAVLCKTVKGYGLGEAGEGLNISHQQKKMNESALRAFRDRFAIPLSDADLERLPLHVPPEDAPEMVYLHKRREALGGYLPRRDAHRAPRLSPPDDALLEEFFQGTGDRPVSTTMAFVRMLTKLLQDSSLGKWIVPMIPDEARTFGMEGLFRQCGIYARAGQTYKPVDRENLMYYREATDGQILEEGITEAGCMGSFIAAGTAYANHGLPAIPFYTFYSMFGLQRVGDLIWAAADSRARGFLMGATSGRTTLAGEGLQHQDGNSHLLAFTVPNLRCYDPATAYELAIIIQDGIRRMLAEGEDTFYYITLLNENKPQPPMPEGVRDAILRGLYCFKPDPDAQVRLAASGAMLWEAMGARDLLDQTFNVKTEVWSVTSFKNLYMDAMAVERWNRTHPTEPQRQAEITRQLADRALPVIAVTDYVKAVAESVARHVPAPFHTLGTDGFGRSDGRPALRAFFGVNAAHIAATTLWALAQQQKFDVDQLPEAYRTLGIDPDHGPENEFPATD